MFQTILLAYDGSDHAGNALKVAANLAKTYGADLHLAHVPQIDMPPIVVGPFVSALEVPPTQAQIAEAGEALVDQAKKRAMEEGVVIVGIHEARHDPAGLILSAADKCGADLIVLGRRGLGSLSALALGSVSQSVSHGAKCACLTVL